MNSDQSSQGVDPSEMIEATREEIEDVQPEHGEPIRVIPEYEEPEELLEEIEPDDDDLVTDGGVDQDDAVIRYIALAGVTALAAITAWFGSIQLVGQLPTGVWLGVFVLAAVWSVTTGLAIVGANEVLVS